MPRAPLWGREGDLTFWTALERGEVPGPEERAVRLLERVVDPFRFSLYCTTGALPCMGNVTKRIYLALKRGGLYELEDGIESAWWCFSIGPYAMEIPDTDQVVGVRAIVEGEELAFLNTGDRHEAGYMFGETGKRPLGVVDPFLTELVPLELWEKHRPDQDLGTAQLLALDDIQRHTGLKARYDQNYPAKYTPEGGGGVDEFPLADGRVFRYDVRALRALGADPLRFAQVFYDLDMKDRGLDGFNYLEAVDQARRKGVQTYVPHYFGQQYVGQQGAMAGYGIGQYVGVAQPYDMDGDLRQRIAARVREEVGFDDIVAAPAGARAVRRPFVPAGIGIDMHDGTTLHIEERADLKLQREHGIRMMDEVDRMLEEGHTPDAIEFMVNQIFEQYLGDGIPNILDAQGTVIGQVGDGRYDNAVLRPVGEDFMLL